MKIGENNISTDNDSKESTVNNSLQKIAKGTGIILFGTVIGMFLGFVGWIIIVRYITQSEYGIYSLSLVLTGIFITISTLGLREGTTRYISIFRGRGEKEKTRIIAFLSIKISLFVSIVFSFILFLLSNFISKNIFNNAALTIPLQLFSIAIPFTILIYILISIFRGFDIVGPKVYFLEILRNVLFILLLIISIWLDLSFIGVLYCYLTSYIITCIYFVAYAIYKSPLPTSASLKVSHSTHIGRKLLFFSIPLLAVSTLNMIMHWTDTLILGYYKTPDIVGLYNGAVPLARLIPVTLISVGFIYVPIASKLFSRNLLSEIGRMYQVLTKWIFSFTLPVILIFILFPETVLNFLFGIEYIPAASTLRLLSFGFIIHISLGLNSLTLLVMGKTRFLMIASSLGVISNVVLNVALIPNFGIVGAAFASLVAYWIINIFNSTKLYRISKIHPFTRNYVKPLVISIMLLSLIYGFAYFVKIEFWMLPIFLFLFLITYGILLILTKSFDKVDIDLFTIIDKSFGFNLPYLI